MPEARDNTTLGRVGGSGVEERGGDGGSHGWGEKKEPLVDRDWHRHVGRCVRGNLQNK